ncbi:MAG: hypothetical protein V3R78_12560 [Thermodesulfobacteriota bacterium]
MISASVKAKMMNSYNDNNPALTIRDMRGLIDDEDFWYAEYNSKSDVIEMYGDLENAPSELADLIKSGKVVELKNEFNELYEYSSGKNIMSYDDYVKDSASKYLKDKPESINDVFSPGVNEYDLADMMYILAESEGWDIDQSRSGAGRYYTLTKDVNGKEINLGVRVSDHSRQSNIGHVIHGLAQVDINLAPATGGDNVFYWADNFDSMTLKLREAEALVKKNLEE